MNLYITNKYFIDISAENNAEEIHLEILIIIGDISLDIVGDGNLTINYDKYILSNKISYYINRKKNNYFQRLIVDINAKMNSYYIIEYKLIRTSDDKRDDIYTGINYLISIPKGNKTEKVVGIHRNKLLEDESYYTSFYSLNCKFEIFRIEKEDNQDNYSPIQSYGNYGEDILEINENENLREEIIYSYKISLIDGDEPSYNNDMCMLYVSSIELRNGENYDLQKEILINEGIPQRIHFTKEDYKIKYIYPNVNKDKDVIIYFNVINSANYTYTITYNHQKK